MAKHVNTGKTLMVAAQAAGGGPVGSIESIVLVGEGGRNWLELTGLYGPEVWTARIPIAEGWTMVREPEEAADVLSGHADDDPECADRAGGRDPGREGGGAPRGVA